MTKRTQRTLKKIICCYIAMDVVEQNESRTRAEREHLKWAHLFRLSNPLERYRNSKLRFIMRNSDKIRMPYRGKIRRGSDEIFSMWRNFRYSVCDEIFGMWRNFRYVTKFSVCDEIFGMWRNFRYVTKFSLTKLSPFLYLFLPSCRVGGGSFSNLLRVKCNFLCQGHPG